MVPFTGITFSCHKMVPEVPRRSLYLSVCFSKMEHTDNTKSRFTMAHQWRPKYLCTSPVSTLLDQEILNSTWFLYHICSSNFDNNDTWMEVKILIKFSSFPFLQKELLSVSDFYTKFILLNLAERFYKYHICTCNAVSKMKSLSLLKSTKEEVFRSKV